MRGVTSNDRLDMKTMQLNTIFTCSRYTRLERFGRLHGHGSNDHRILLERSSRKSRLVQSQRGWVYRGQDCGAVSRIS